MSWILVKRQLSRRTVVNGAIGSYSIRFVVRHGAGAPLHAKPDIIILSSRVRSVIWRRALLAWANGASTIATRTDAAVYAHRIWEVKVDKRKIGGSPGLAGKAVMNRSPFNDLIGFCNEIFALL
jgi:hypothetical protein